MTDFQRSLRDLINKHSAENGSDTPDFILAKYLDSCLVAYETAVIEREKWWTEFGKEVGLARR